MYGIALKHGNEEEVKAYLDGVADAEINSIGYYVLRDGRSWYLRMDGKPETIETATKVYSLIVNGRRISMSTETQVDIEGAAYYIAVKGIERTTAGSRITISMSPA